MAGRGLALALLGALLSQAPVADAAYWTRPVNYYALDTLRYPMTETGPVSLIPSVAAGVDGLRYGATVRGGSLTGVEDAERGLVARFDRNAKARVRHPFPNAEHGGSETSASLSFWINLSDAEDQMIAARGDRRAGYSLSLQGGRLTFVYWANGGESPLDRHGLQSVTTLRPGAWRNVIITQASGKAEGGAYVAIYVDGVLQASARSDIPGSGLLGDRAGDSNAALGGAMAEGWLWIDDTFDPYRRDEADGGKIRSTGLWPFMSARLSEFRYFGGLMLVCSDKTRSRAEYAAGNREIEVGARCPLTSDVASLAQDRIEQASYLARLPLRADVGDHNFAGLGVPNRALAGSHPTFVADPMGLRQTVAHFDGRQRVDFDMLPQSALSLSDYTPPYSLSMWINPDAATLGAGAMTLFALGDKNEGLRIHLDRGRVAAGLWNHLAPACQGAWARSERMIGPGWRHVAVSIDAPSADRSSGGGAAANGLRIFVDGRQVASRHVGSVTHAMRGRASLGAAPTDETCGYVGDGQASVSDQRFRGRISEVKVLRAPITAPQARRLASRYPNAYSPVYAALDFPRVAENPDPAILRTPGYVYQDMAPATALPFDTWRNPFASLELRFSARWRRPAQPWRGYAGDNASDPDCEYVIGGAFWGQRTDGPAEEATSVLLCFSPKKIGQRLPPFSLALFYPAYNRYLFVTVIDPMIPADVLEQLKSYPAIPNGGKLETEFRLNIGQYNMLLQAKTVSDLYPEGMEPPNYISPLYQGAQDLARQALRPMASGPARDRITYVRSEAVPAFDLRYVDQRALLDDIDMNLSKDR